MENGFFHRAAQDPALMREAAEALRAALGGEGTATPDEVRDLVRRAEYDPALKAALAGAIEEVAVRHGLTVERPEVSSHELSDDDLAAVAGGKDNPQQISIGMPIAFLFIAAALIFLPSIFKTAGGSLFDSGGSAR